MYWREGHVKRNQKYNFVKKINKKTRTTKDHSSFPSSLQNPCRTLAMNGVNPPCSLPISLPLSLSRTLSPSLVDERARETKRGRMPWLLSICSLSMHLEGEPEGKRRSERRGDGMPYRTQSGSAYGPFAVIVIQWVHSFSSLLFAAYYCYDNDLHFLWAN